MVRRFLDWFVDLGFLKQLFVIIAAAVCASVIVAPTTYYLLAGFLPPFMFTTSIITAVLVSAPLGSIFIAIAHLLAESRRRNRQAKRQLENKNLVFHSLLDFSVEMQKSDELLALLEGFVKRLDGLFPRHHFGVLVDSSRPRMVRYFSGEGITEEEQHWLINNNAALTDESDLRQEGPEALSAPSPLNRGDALKWYLLALRGRKGNLLGKLIVKGEALDVEQREVLRLFAEQLSATMENKLLSLELEKMANVDELTGVYNRSFFQRELSRQIEKKKESAALDYALLVADINGLKETNDSHGHVTGDQLIIEVCRHLQESCRREDIVFRLGGDEFVILCPSTTLAEGQRLLERIQSRLAGAVMHCGGVAIPLSVSLGLACSTETRPESVYSLADQRMYISKRRYHEARAKEA